jgi:uncharacterized protein YggE
MRRSAFLILLVAGALVLGACGNEQPASINVNTGESQTGVSVTGVGEVTGTPDTVEVDLGISVLADTVEEAAAQAAEKTQALIDALTGGGVAEDDITTLNYSIYPEYSYSGNAARITGYRVTNTVRATIRDIESSGSVIDDAVAAGGDDTQVSGLRFSIEDDTELVEQARSAAWDDAFAKATQLAELSGQSLGAAISIHETVTNVPPPYFDGRDLAGGEGDYETPIEPGTSEVTITLSVQFELGG